MTSMKSDKVKIVITSHAYLSSLSNDSMEIAQREQNHFEFGLLATHLKRFLRKVVEGLVNVRFNASRRFVRDFNARLEDSLWDYMSRSRRRRFCTDEDSVVLVRSFRVVFELLFQCR